MPPVIFISYGLYSGPGKTGVAEYHNIVARAPLFKGQSIKIGINGAEIPAERIIHFEKPEWKFVDGREGVEEGFYHVISCLKIRAA